jgi:hypothetical protein
MGDAGADLHAEAAEMIRDELGGPGFAIGKLRVLVDVTPPGNDFALHLGNESVDLSLVLAGLGVQEAGAAEGDGRQEEWSHEP